MKLSHKGNILVELLFSCWIIWITLHGAIALVALQERKTKAFELAALGTRLQTRGDVHADTIDLVLADGAERLGLSSFLSKPIEWGISRETPGSAIYFFRHTTVTLKNSFFPDTVQHVVSAKCQ